ncbi:P-loop containing nucleoside triphosphate hydrolase protein [Mortierella sp. GBAus27b]|nr:hypothetical protein BGX31_001101 [Mortierella sp. GBA43]KAI8357931.1 P-loop containing nucleoside triphosphate hydrolase protein [Mortierella sp. GBAus27b]
MAEIALTHRPQCAHRLRIPTGTTSSRSGTVVVATTTRRYTANAALVREEAIVAAAKADVSSAKLISEDTTVVTKPRQRRSKTATAAESPSTPETIESTATIATTVRKRKTTKKETVDAVEEVAASVVKPTRTRKPKAAATNIATSTTASMAPIQLRPYQQECIDTCLENLEKGITRQIVSLPVGSGKTVIFSHLMKKVKPPFPGANKTLVLAHRQELLEQTQNHVLRTGTGLTVSIDQGKRQADMTADVIVASVATLGRAGTLRLLKYNPQEFKCIIIDEAHHAAAESYGRVLEHFGAHVPETHIFVYGCSATVRRHDGIKLGGAFDHISYHKSFINMIEEKWLCGLRVSTINTDFDLRDVKMQGGDFSQKELAMKVNTPLRNDVVVRSYMTYCKDRKSTVVFAVDIEHLETLTRLFRDYGYDARGLSSKTDDGERAKMLREFREQKFPIIVNCGILTEGTDIPNIDSIIMARPTKSNVLFLQMLGRGMRLHPGKEDCLVLDFVDVVKGDGLVTLPTLLGLDPESVLNKTAAVRNQEDLDDILKDEIETIEQSPIMAHFPDETETVETIDPITGAKVARIRVLEYENPYQLLGDCSGVPKRLWSMSLNAWVNVGPDVFVLTYKDTTFRIEKSPEDGLYRCQKRIQMVNKEKDDDNSTALSRWARRMGFWPKRDVSKSTKSDGDADAKRWKSKGTMLPIESDTLQDCIHGVDTWITKTIGHKPGLLGRSARWRSLPASEAQLGFLRRLGYVHGEDYSMDIRPEEALQKWGKPRDIPKPLTKGQAANMITRLVNGAGKWWEMNKKFRIKRAKDLAKEIGVDIGPIPKFKDV